MSIMVPNKIIRRFADPSRVGCVRVVGESMQPTLMDQDAVLLEKDVTPKPGDVVGVNIFNPSNPRLIRAVMGRLGQTARGVFWLYKDNPGHQYCVLLGTADRFAIIGVARVVVERSYPDRVLPTMTDIKIGKRAAATPTGI